jgi:predicted kinase
MTTEAYPGLLDAHNLWLIAMMGDAGSGKSTLSRALSRRLRWPVIDKDDIRDLLDDRTPGLSYDIMFNIARRQLLQGLHVICDSPLTGGPWHAAQIAAETRATLAFVECHCPDEAIWRARINSRKELNLPAHHQTDWEAMHAHQGAAGSPEQTSALLDTHHHLVVNTLLPVESLCTQVVGWLVDQTAGRME